MVGWHFVVMVSIGGPKRLRTLVTTYDSNNMTCSRKKNVSKPKFIVSIE